MIQKPFLKWAGGKTKLAEKIVDWLPHGSRLVEPFVGSGAVFLNVDSPAYLLSDSNTDLINLYLSLTQHKKKFIDHCKSYFKSCNNAKENFNILRDRFNKSTDVFDRSAIFVYLNRHCFNGLCRYNSDGLFNTPFGDYDEPYFPYKEMVEFIERARTATFKVADFRATFKEVKSTDVVYCDPPYLPISDTSNFTSYSTDGFNLKDQQDLVTLARNAPCPVLISNHDTPQAREIYREATHVEPIKVGRSVGGDRKPVSELLVMYNAMPQRNVVRIWDI